MVKEVHKLKIYKNNFEVFDTKMNFFFSTEKMPKFCNLEKIKGHPIHDSPSI